VEVAGVAPDPAVRLGGDARLSIWKIDLIDLIDL
jgi:hypothetical protein